MTKFRINAGGIAIILAFLVIGFFTMARHPFAGLALGALTFVSLLFHECGHILAAALTGQRVKEFGVCLKGSYVRRTQSSDPLAEIAISLSGPMVNTVIAAAIWTLPGLWHWLALFNFVLAIGNLAPFPGSDGHHALTARRRAAAVAASAHRSPHSND